MAQKVMVNGTVREIDGGKELVGGTVRKNDYGKVLFKGTVKKIHFSEGFTVVVDNNVYSVPFWKIAVVSPSSRKEITSGGMYGPYPSGTEIQIEYTGFGFFTIYFNGTVVSNGYPILSYTYKEGKNITIYTETNQGQLLHIDEV